MPRRRRRPLLLFALLGSLALHLAFTLPILVPLNLFPPKAPPPEPIPVEIVSLPPPPQKEAPKPPEPPPEPQKAPEPPPKPVVIPPPQPPPPVTPDQIVVATRDIATPPQGDDKPNAAPEKPESSDKPVPMAPPPPEAAAPEEKPLPMAPPPPEKAESLAKPEPPRPAPIKPEPPPEREITGAIALAKPTAKPRNQQTAPDHKMPPVVVRPTAPGRAGNSLMPSYPSAARANGLQGRVVLLVTLSPDGRPRRIDIARSSGHDQLDESAVRAVWLWRFYRTDSGPPVEATIEIPLDFKL